MPFPLKRHGVEHGGTPETISFAQSPGAQEGTNRHARDDRPEGARDAWKTITGQIGIKALVAARHKGKRRARSETRRLQTCQRKEDRSIAQALGGAQFAPQGRRLSFSAIDADFLHQPRRQDITQDPARPVGAGQGGIEAAVSSRLSGRITRHARHIREGGYPVIPDELNVSEHWIIRLRG
jgi:hypothetical protein